MLTLILILFTFFIFSISFYTISCLIFEKYDLIIKFLLSFTISIFFIILIMYILSLTNSFNRFNFIVFFFGVVIFSNLIVYFIYKKIGFKFLKFSGNDFKYKTIYFFLILIFSFFLRIYDSYVRKDYSNVDVYNHYNMTLATLNGNPHAVFGSYNRGFHLIAIAIHWLTSASIYDCIRFLGPILCSISVIAVYIFIKNIKGKNPALLSALFYGCLTFDSPLLRRQTISLSETPIFFLMPLALMFLFYIFDDLKNSKIRYENILGFLLFTFLIAIIHPISAMYFQYILIMFLVMVLIKYFLKKFSKLHNSKITITKINVIAIFILILMVMPFTVYGYAKLSKEKSGSTYTFVVEAKNDNKNNDFLNLNSDLLGDSSTFKNLLKDIFSSNEEKLKNDVSLFLYYAIIFTIIILFLSIFYFFKKDFFTSFLASSIFFLGIILLTGFGEPSMYRLRSSVYFIFFALIFFGISVEKIIWKISQISKNIPNLKNYFTADFKKIFAFSFVFFFAVLAVSATFFNWGYTHLGYEDNVVVVLKIKNEYSMENVAVYSGDFGGSREGKIVTANCGIYYNLEELLYYSPMNLSRINNESQNIFDGRKQIFIFIEKKLYPLTIENFKEVAYADQLDDIKEDINNRESIIKKAEIWIEEYKRYHDIEIYYETSNIVVYLIEKNKI